MTNAKVDVMVTLTRGMAEVIGGYRDEARRAWFS